MRLDAIRAALKLSVAEHLRHHALIPEWDAPARAELAAVENALTAAAALVTACDRRSRAPHDPETKAEVKERMAAIDGYLDATEETRAALVVVRSLTKGDTA